MDISVFCLNCILVTTGILLGIAPVTGIFRSELILQSIVCILIILSITILKIVSTRKIARNVININ